MLYLTMPTTARAAKATNVNNNIPLLFELPWWRSGGGGTFDYLDKKRDLAYLARAYGKMAYASAGGYDTIWGKNNLPATITQETVDADDTTKPGGKKSVTTEPIYAQYNTAGETKFRPKNHLVSISTSGDPGTYGNIRYGNYTYRTYDGSLGNLPNIGDLKYMSWGWAFADTPVGGASFSGKVLGYDIQSNTEGGFDVSVKLIGENNSISIAGLSVDVSIPLSNPGVKDASGNTFSIADIFSAIEACSIEAINKPVGAASFNNGIQGCVAEVPENIDKPDTEPTTDNPSPLPKKAYVTFQSIVDLTNKVLAQHANYGIQLYFAGSGYDAPLFDPQIYSANPLEVLLPGKGMYGTKDYSAAGSSATSGNTIRFPNILISAEVVGKLGKAAVSESEVGSTKKKTLSIKSFYDKLVDTINQNIGIPFSYTLTNSGTTTDKNIYIADLSVTPPLTPKTISTVRSANLSATLDSDAQKSFFIINRAPSEIKSNTAKADQTAPPTPAQYAELVANVGQKANNGNTNALKSANKLLVSAAAAGKPGFGSFAPWNLSVTLDGASGWEYGQLITYSPMAVSQLIPGYKVAFIISDIQHNVSDGDWTVSLSTICKVYL